MQEKNNDDVIEIDLQEVVGLLVHWLWLIIGCGIITGVLGFLISFLVITPMYESTTKVYILDRDSSGNSLTYSDVQLGTVLTKDYTQLIKDRTVLEAVLDTFEMAESYGSLQKRVTVEALSDTRIINITVEDADPLTAQMLANEIREVAAKHIQDVMAIEAVNVVEEANLPTAPSSPSIIKWTGIGALLGAFVCAMILVIRFLMDDTIKTSDDVEKYLGLSTLAMIPVIEDDTAKEKGKGRKTNNAQTSRSEKNNYRKNANTDEGELEEVVF